MENGHDLGGSFPLGPWRVHRSGYGQILGRGLRLNADSAEESE